MRVSVIIPCFNVQDYIHECLHSVFNQTYKEIEIICVDNNSSDNTLKYLKQISEEGTKPFTVIVAEEKAPGANAARNKGLSLATGDWIQFLDADDLLEPQKIAHQVKLVQAGGMNIGFVAGAFKRRLLNDTEEKIVIDINKDVYAAAFLNKCGNTCSNLWNRNALLNAGAWSIQIKSSQETDLMMRIVLAGYIYLIDELPATIIRERESGQISQGNPTKRLMQYIDIRLAYMQNLKQQSMQNYDRLKGLFYDFIMVTIIELAGYDFTSANNYYKTHIRANWQSSGNYGFTKLKYRIIKYFGLKTFLLIRR